MIKKLLLLIFILSSVAQSSNTTINSLPFSTSSGGSESEPETLFIAGDVLFSTTNGIEIDYPWVVLDLQGDTVVFGTDPTYDVPNAYGNPYGVWIKYVDNCKIVNGSVIHRPDSIIWDNANKNNMDSIAIARPRNAACIRLSGWKAVVESVHTYVTGFDSYCIVTVGDRTSRYASNRDSEIFGATHNNASLGYLNRNEGSIAFHLGQAGFADDSLEWEWHFKVHDLTIVNTPHVGISVSKMLTYVYNCFVTVDARNDFYEYQTDNNSKGAANSDGILFTQAQGGTQIYNNVVLADSNYGGFDVGIGANRVAGTAGNHVDVYNNTVIGWQGFDAYFGYLRCKAYKTRWGSKYLHFYNNYGLIYSDGDTLTTFRGPEGIGYNLSTNYEIDGSANPHGDSNCIWENNTLIAIALDSGATMATAVRPETFRETSTGDTSFTLQNLIWRNNHLIASRTVYEGEGHDGSMRNFIAESDTVEGADSLYDFVTIHAGHFSLGGTGNEFIDLIYLTPTTYDDIDIESYPGVSADVTIRRTCEITVDDTLGNPIEDAIVWATNDYGDTAFVDTTDASGLASGVANYLYDSDDFGDSTAFNDFIFKAKLNDDSATVTFTLAWDHYDTTIVLGTDAGVPDTSISQVITCIDTTTTTLQIVDDFTLSNTVVDTVIFEASDDAWSSVISADTIGSPTDPDTSILSGLTANTEYTIRCRAWDSSEGVTDTSNVLTITTDAVEGIVKRGWFRR